MVRFGPWIQDQPCPIGRVKCIYEMFPKVGLDATFNLEGPEAVRAFVIVQGKEDAFMTLTL